MNLQYAGVVTYRHRNQRPETIQEDSTRPNQADTAQVLRRPVTDSTCSIKLQSIEFVKTELKFRHDLKMNFPRI